jgi:predicted CopG family antitoxin
MFLCNKLQKLLENYKYSISIYALLGTNMRTTIELNDAIYKKIIKTNGKRNISNTINEILNRYFLKKEKNDMFGSDKWLKKTGTGDLRDEYDRDN